MKHVIVVIVVQTMLQFLYVLDAAVPDIIDGYGRPQNLGTPRSEIAVLYEPDAYHKKSKKYQEHGRIPSRISSNYLAKSYFGGR